MHKVLTAFIIVVMLLISAVVVAPLWLRLISEHKRLESAHRKLSKVAYTDRETGLPNLDGLELQLTDLISFENKETGFYLLLVRIRNLDQVYNLIGSQSAEALLHAISNRLQNFGTEQQQWCRSGEAEFTCLQTEGRVNNADLWAEEQKGQTLMLDIISDPEVNLQFNLLKGSASPYMTPSSDSQDICSAQVYKILSDKEAVIPPYASYSNAGHVHQLDTEIYRLWKEAQQATDIDAVVATALENFSKVLRAGIQEPPMATAEE